MKLPEISSCSWERDPGEYSKHELHPEMSLLTWFRTGVRFSSPPPEKKQAAKKAAFCFFYQYSEQDLKR